MGQFVRSKNVIKFDVYVDSHGPIDGWIRNDFADLATQEVKNDSCQARFMQVRFGIMNESCARVAEDFWP